MNRQHFKTRSILLAGPLQQETALAALRNAPMDSERPIEMLLREQVKTRRLDQNAAMWAGPLLDIAEQAWVGNRQFSAEVWHEWFKRKYLPEDNDPRLSEMVKEGYRKWEFGPDGQPVLVGSTTQLTEFGFAYYLRQVEADGASLGVMFHANPRMAA